MITYKVTVEDNGTTTWYNDKSQLHRLDGPAVERKNGDKVWYHNGILHRLDGPAMEYTSGHKQWLVNGEHHRLDGPAIECSDGTKEWWVNNQQHRLDGPAVEWPDGDKEWYIEGVYYIEEQFKAKIDAMNRPCAGKKIVVDGVDYILS